MSNITDKIFSKDVIDFFKDLIIIVLVVLFIRTFFAMPFQISGQSMYDSYYDKQFIIVDRFSYLYIPKIKAGTVKRGDVIVFQPNVNADKKYFIKRVIGIAGDTVKIEAGNVYVRTMNSGEFIENNEAYLSKDNNGDTRVNDGKKEFLVPE